MSSVRRSLGWSFLQNYSNTIIQFISSMVLARLLAPSDIGIYSLCATIISIANIMRDLGVGEYLVQEKELSRERIKAAFGITLMMGTLAFIILNIISGPIADFYHTNGLKSVISVLSFNFLILPFCTPIHALLSRQMAFRPIFIIQTTSIMIGSITSIILALKEFGYMSLAWGSLTTSFFILLISMFWRPADACVLPGVREWRRVFSYATFATGNSIITLIGGRFQDFTIGRIMGFHSLGIFSRGLGLLEAFNQAIIPAVGRVAFPAFAAHYQKSGNLNEHFEKIISILSVISLPFFTFVALLAFPLMRLLFGSQWDESVPIVQITFLAQIIYSLWAFAPLALKVTGHVKEAFIVSGMSTFIYMPLMITLAFFSLKAVAVGIVFSNLISLILYMHYLKKAINFSWINLMESLRSSMMVTIVTCSIPALLIGTKILNEQEPFITLTITSSIALFCWTASISKSQHPIKKEIDHIWIFVRSTKLYSKLELSKLFYFFKSKIGK